MIKYFPSDPEDYKTSSSIYVQYGDRLAFYFVCVCPAPTETNRIHNTHLNNLETKCMLNTYSMLL